MIRQFYMPNLATVLENAQTLLHKILNALPTISFVRNELHMNCNLEPMHGLSSCNLTTL